MTGYLFVALAVLEAVAGPGGSGTGCVTRPGAG